MIFLQGKETVFEKYQKEKPLSKSYVQSNLLFAFFYLVEK